ncbi:phage tail tape measure protein [Bacillus cihuensis]|uniref:phage tail tape measure protein n=1 Tax=Bacillus cihuensis TaxID=1208599 RepID=UPI0003FBBCA0|nr:phage tail tape measure protein [Bacillus cihuensis]
MAMMVKIGADTRQFERQMKTLTKEFSTVSNKLNSAGKTMSTYVTAPLVGLGAVAAKTGMEFEATMSKVAATMGKPVSAIGELNDLAREMGKTTKFTAIEAADAINYMALAGWDSQKIMAGLPGLLNLAAAGGMDLATAADIVTDAMTGMGLGADQTGKIVDMMAKTASNANTSVEQMGKAMILVAGQSNTLGIEANDLALSLGLMANAGFKGEIAGQHLSAGIRRLTDPTNRAKKAMDKYGIAISKNEDGSFNLGKTIETMREKLNGLNKVQKAQALSAIFGADAQKSWAGIINASAGDFDKLKDAIANADGAGAEMAATMQDNLLGKINLMQAALQELSIQIYDYIKPALEAIVLWVTGLAESFANASPETKKFVLALIGIAAAIGPLLLVAAQIVAFTGKLKALWTMIKAGQSAFAVFTMAAGGPVTLIILALVALGVAIAALVIYWDEITAYFKTNLPALYNIFKAQFEAMKQTITGVFNGIKTIILGAWQVIKGIFQFWTGLINGIVTGDFTTMKKGLTNIFSGLVNILGGLATTAISLLTHPFRMIAATLSGIFESMKSNATSTFSSMISGIKSFINGAIGAFNKFSGGINKAIGKINSVPGVNIPTIPSVPMLATGGSLFGNGSAIVGEAGPELISKSGSAVKVTPLSAGEKARGIGGAVGGQGIIIKENNFVIREEADIDKIATKLNQLVERKSRATGRLSLT